MSFRDWLGTLPGLERRSMVTNAYCLALRDEFDTLHERLEKLAREKRVMACLLKGTMAGRLIRDGDGLASFILNQYRSNDYDHYYSLIKVANATS